MVPAEDLICCITLIFASNWMILAKPDNTTIMSDIEKKSYESIVLECIRLKHFIAILPGVSV